jgi:hypothetical protein
VQVVGDKIFQLMDMFPSGWIQIGTTNQITNQGIVTCRSDVAPEPGFSDHKVKDNDKCGHKVLTFN